MYDLKIGNPVTPPKAPKDVYEVHIKLMHGDGDKYETDEFQTDELQEVLDIVTFWMHWKTLDHNHKCDLRHGGEELSDLIKGLDVDCDLIYDVVLHGDVTNDHQSYCSINGIEIFQYGETGIKYHVNVIDEEDNEVVTL